jgi:uncharacterized membrane protein YfhO
LAQTISSPVAEMLQEENIICESVVATAYAVKLSAKQMAKYGKYQQEVLLSLFNIRNNIAEAYNLPPSIVVTDITLEDLVDNKSAFIANPFARGFCSRLQEDDANKKIFYDAIEKIDENIKNTPTKKERVINEEKKLSRDISKELVEVKCKKIANEVSTLYGDTAGEYILRGLKKSILVKPYAEIRLRKYQHVVIDEVCKKLNISL